MVERESLQAPPPNGLGLGRCVRLPAPARSAVVRHRIRRPPPKQGGVACGRRRHRAPPELPRCLMTPRDHRPPSDAHRGHQNGHNFLEQLSLAPAATPARCRPRAVCMCRGRRTARPKTWDPSADGATDTRSGPEVAKLRLGPAGLLDAAASREIRVFYSRLSFF